MSLCQFMKTEPKDVQNAKDAQRDLKLRCRVMHLLTQSVSLVLLVGTMTSAEGNVNHVPDVRLERIFVGAVKIHGTQSVGNVRDACFQLIQI